MAFNWFDIIVAFGILQGLLCSVLLWKYKPCTVSRQLLIAILLTFSVLSFKILLHTLKLWDTQVFRYFPLGIDLLIQPLLYLYVCSLVDPWFQVKGKRRLHFMPPLLFLAHAMVVYTMLLPITSLPAKDVIAEKWHYDAVKEFEDYLSVISAVVYGILSFRAVQKYRAWLFSNIADPDYNTFAWLKNVLTLMGVLGISLFVNIALDNFFHFGRRHFIHWQLFFLYMSALIYYMGLRGYLRPDSVIADDVPFRNKSVSATAKYQDTELAAAKVAILKALNDDKVFINSELTLNILAAHVGLGAALVSAAINKEFGKNFRTLVNDHRIEEVKQKLTDPRFVHLSILGIALECGFNSEASFYRLFRSATGLSPKEYIVKMKYEQ